MVRLFQPEPAGGRRMARLVADLPLQTPLLVRSPAALTQLTAPLKLYAAGDQVSSPMTQPGLIRYKPQVAMFAEQPWGVPPVGGP